MNKEVKQHCTISVGIDGVTEVIRQFPLRWKCALALHKMFQVPDASTENLSVKAKKDSTSHLSNEDQDKYLVIGLTRYLEPN